MGLLQLGLAAADAESSREQLGLAAAAESVVVALHDDEQQLGLDAASLCVGVVGLPLHDSQVGSESCG